MEETNWDILSDGHKETLAKYDILNRYARKGETLFAGSSLMEFFPLLELAQDMGLQKTLYNRGIAGFTTYNLAAHMDTCIFDLEPSVIFINIGTNDIGSANGKEYSKEDLFASYRSILSRIRERLPKTRVYIMAYYPVNEQADFGRSAVEKASMFATRTNAALREANEALPALAAEFGYTYIDANGGLTDETGNLKPEYSVEGVHMYPNAYWEVLKNLKKYL